MPFLLAAMAAFGHTSRHGCGCAERLWLPHTPATLVASAALDRELDDEGFWTLQAHLRGDHRLSPRVWAVW